VIVAPDSAAWVTEGGQNAIARIDPATRAVKLFPLPKERRDANLNTASFDRQGVLWFTGQNGIYGRPDPKMGGYQGGGAGDQRRTGGEKTPRCQGGKDDQARRRRAQGERRGAVERMAPDHASASSTVTRSPCRSLLPISGSRRERKGRRG
jgi:hypothetical protein